MRCPYCGMEVQSGAERCHNCAATIPASQATESSGTSQQNTSAQYSQGTRVMGRWTNGLWYPGVIDGANSGQFHVKFDDQDQAWLSPSDITSGDEKADDMNGALRSGSRVEGRWGDGNWYPGTLSDAYGRVWRVAFDDGDVGWLDSTRIRITGQAGQMSDPGGMQPFAAPKYIAPKNQGKNVAIISIACIIAGAFSLGLILLFSTEDSGQDTGTPGWQSLGLQPIQTLGFQTVPVSGTRVLAPWPDGRFFVGIVQTTTADGQANVSFLDGDTNTVPIASLRQDSIAPGAPIAASRQGREGWHAGTVGARNQDSVMVQFRDGSSEWVPLSRVFVMSASHR